MIFIRLWNYLVGYVIIRVEGLSLEKFINLAVSRNIYLWKIQRHGYTTLTACVSIKGFKKLHAVSRKISCRIRIVEKQGFPFVANRYRHRKMLIFGMFVFVVMLYGFSSFVWAVDVLGTETVDPQRIKTELASVGIYPGAFKSGIDTMYIENRLIINIPEISWLSLEIRGSRAIVRVAEAVLPPEMIDRETPVNIVAKKDGIIHDMIILEGEAAVVIGQTVQKDQLLVSGVIDHPATTGTRYVHAMGQIMARTWVEGSGVLFLREPMRKQTGEKVEVRHIGMGEINESKNDEEIKFAQYDKVIRKEPIFPKGQFLPLYIIVEEYYEVEEFNWADDMDMAKKRAADLAWADARKKIPSGAKVIDKKFKYDIIEGETITAIVYVETLEDIGMIKKINVQ